MRRGNAGTQLLYDPDRLKYPMLRTGARGEGKFKRISWDQALDLLATTPHRTEEEIRSGKRGIVSPWRGAGFLCNADESIRHSE